MGTDASVSHMHDEHAAAVILLLETLGPGRPRMNEAMQGREVVFVAEVPTQQRR